MEKVWSFDKFGDLIFDVGSEKEYAIKPMSCPVMYKYLIRV